MFSMRGVRVITGEDCWYCDQAKKLLNEHNIEYEEVDVFEASAIMQEYNLRTVPQIFVEGKLLGGGYTGLKEYFDGK